MTMVVFSALLLFALASSCSAYVLAQRAEQILDQRATYQGSWALNSPGKCPANLTVVCGAATDAQQTCCPSGNTCFSSGSVTYCCPTNQDCTKFVNTFPQCADLAANMYSWGNGYYCCAQDLVAVKPLLGWGFCQAQNLAAPVPTSILATMASQFGGTSVTPFGGYATAASSGVAGGATTTGAEATAAKTGSSAATSTPGGSSNTSPTTPKIDLGNGAIAGIAIGAAFLLILIYMGWKCCSNRNWRPFSSDMGGNRPGRSMRPSYVAAPDAMLYDPKPELASHQPLYDPVTERPYAGSPLGALSHTPPPVEALASPNPKYRAVEAVELGRSGERLEIHGDGSTRGRVEMG